jgi:hypothetical protein
MKAALALLLILLVHLSFAQQNTNLPLKQNGFSITLGHSQFKDENIHPKAFHGLTIGASFQHSRITGNISEYSLGLELSAMNTEYEEFPSSVNILILGNYRYLFPLFQNENLKYFFGLVADMQYGTSAYFNWDESHLYFANYLSGGIGNRINYRMGEKLFGLYLDIPVISCIFRPEYNRQYKIDDMTFGGILSNLWSNPEAALPNKNFYVKTGLEMQTPSKGEKIHSIGYNFKYHYMKATNGNRYQNIENVITYKFIF